MTEQPEPEECNANRYGGREDCGCDMCREYIAERDGEEGL